jgi:hypothetical protein
VKRLATAPARTHRATNASTILDDLPIFQVPLFLRNIPLLGMLLGTPAFQEIHPLAFEILESSAPKVVGPVSGLSKPPGGPFTLAVRQ